MHSVAAAASDAISTAQMDNRPLYSSRIFHTFLKLIAKRYPYVNVKDLLSYAGMQLYEVEDEGHWFTQEQSDRFYERLVKLTGNKDLAREAGRYAASPEALGLMRHFILGNVDPGTTYELIGKASPNFTRAETFEAARAGPNRVEITVKTAEGVQEKPYQCENRLGYLEAVSTIFNYRMPQIEHDECMFKGGHACHYVVSWYNPPSTKWKVLRNYSSAALLLACVASGVFFTWPTTSLILLFSMFWTFFITTYIMSKERTELLAAIDNFKGSADKLIDQVNRNYNNALLINEIGLALSKLTNVDGILRNVVQILEKRLDYDRGMILLANEERTQLEFRAGFGYNGKMLEVIRHKTFRLDKSWSKGIFYLCFENKKPFLVNNIDEIKDDLSPKSLEFAKLMGSKSFICCPIVYEDRSIGVLAVDNVHSKRPLLQSDISLLMGIAPEIGVSIHNQMMVESRERQFHSLLQVLAASIDARDFLTAGHSDKVTEYAVGISRELGMDKEYLEMIRVAALLHDYGKIGIKDSILKKDGKLTDEEFSEIKTHAEKTRAILERVNFEGIYREVPEVAGSHHEKMDGSGYPRGLRGEQIHLGARIIAVADVFEAITAKRHYRNPMPLDAAFRVLLKASGSHLDPKAVKAFISYYAREYGPLPDIEEIRSVTSLSSPGT